MSRLLRGRPAEFSLRESANAISAAFSSQTHGGARPHHDTARPIGRRSTGRDGDMHAAAAASRSRASAEAAPSTAGIASGSGPSATHLQAHEEVGAVLEVVLPLDEAPARGVDGGVGVGGRVEDRKSVV